MARKSTANSKEDVKENINIPETPEVETVEVETPLNLEQQVTVKSIAGWATGFARILTIGDVEIPKRGSIRLSRNEIITQAHMGNRLISGNDSRGSHATLIIEDKATIRELGFENAVQFSDKRVKDLFDIQDQYEFEERLKEEIQTRAEKYALMVSIYKQGLNDFSKIRFCENYTGYNMDNVKKDDDNRDIRR